MHSPIPRPALRASISTALARSRAVALLGPRQSGKTTLARTFLEPDSPNYFDLEHPLSLARLENPLLALEPLRGLAVIDEIQLRPELFPILRVLCDRANTPARFLILGSASPQLVRASAESLAGRIETIEVTPFSLPEVGMECLDAHWVRGGFPLSFLAGDEPSSRSWREGFVQQFLLRDLPQLGITIPSTNLRRFWTMLAHYQGQTWNASEIGGSLGVSGHTTRHYLDILSETFLIRQLAPWHENIAKRQVRAPKIYFRDSGIFHTLLGIPGRDGLELHPKLGASWEGYALEEVIRATRPDQVYFWAVHNGAELDLLCFKDGKRFGFGFKYQDAPRLTQSMRTAREVLGLESLTVVYPGKTRYPLAPGIEAAPFGEIVARPAA